MSQLIYRMELVWLRPLSSHERWVYRQRNSSTEKKTFSTISLSMKPSLEDISSEVLLDGLSLPAEVCLQIKVKGITIVRVVKV